MGALHADCLIVANQTVGGAALREAVEDRIEAGRTSFFVVVPRVAPREEATRWTPMQSAGGLSAGVAAGAAAEDEASRRSLHRLTYLLDAIRGAGGEADGMVASTNPVVAVRRALEQRSVDEIVVSTLPPGMSRWLRMDVVARLERLADVPVTWVTSAPEGAGRV